MVFHWQPVDMVIIRMGIIHTDLRPTIIQTIHGLKSNRLLHMRICKLHQFFYFLIFVVSIFRYATVTTNQGALIIGGTDITGDLAMVHCYNNASWSRLNDLQSSRYAHRAIVNGDKVYIIGGNYEK